MSSEETKKASNTTVGDAKAIEHLKRAVAGGKHWYLALLEAIKLWRSSEEKYQGRHWRYLIDGEAFDWLLLAERLTDEIKQYIPDKERINLLFFDVPPVELGKEEFKRIIGPAKYRAYLNYLYGVLVEENLIAAVVDEIRKETLASGLHKREDILDKAYRRIYGDTQQVLLDKFRKEKKYRKRKSTNLSELKEFTYWLFKYRIKKSDKSRVASDTKKALLKMQQNLTGRRPQSGRPSQIIT
jgi:hypothetical protein